MTKKQLRYMRAFLVGSSEFVIDDNATHERLKRYDILDRLNELNDENEQLKTQLQNTSDQRDEFHRGARENANLVGKLEKENEELKMKLKKQKDEELEWALSQIEDNKALAIIEKRLGKKNTMLRAKSVPCQH